MSKWDKLYKTKEWKQLRQAQLARCPYCQCPHHKGQQVKANVVDHIVPHKGNMRLFIKPDNLQSMTKQCHDKFKQSREKGGNGFLMGCDENGLPLSKDHNWYD